MVIKISIFNLKIRKISRAFYHFIIYKYLILNLIRNNLKHLPASLQSSDSHLLSFLRCPLNRMVMVQYNF